MNKCLRRKTPNESKCFKRIRWLTQTRVDLGENSTQNKQFLDTRWLGWSQKASHVTVTIRFFAS
jgi:hypothetical protein